MATYLGEETKGTPNSTGPEFGRHARSRYDANGDLKIDNWPIASDGSWFRPEYASETFSDPAVPGAKLFNKDGSFWAWEPGVGYLLVAEPGALKVAKYREDGSISQSGQGNDGKWHEATPEVALTEAQLQAKIFHDLLAGIGR